LDDQERDKVRAVIRSQVEARTVMAAEKVAEAETQLTHLVRQERKLLAAHYDGKISEDLFSEEQTRIGRERNAAKKRIDNLSVDHDRAMKVLDLALDLSDDVQTAYLLAGPEERRMLNQRLSEHFQIENEEVVADSTG
jgi:hypothetical protein